MDWHKIKTNIEKLFQKYKFVLLIIAAGILLMLWPATQDGTKATQANENPVTTSYDIELELKTILSQVKGAGRVEVLLTESLGENTVFQTNRNTDGDSAREDTVIITASDRGEGGLIVRKDPPKYQGAIIVCDGADDAFVCLQIVEAVSRATGLGADRISVLKMK